MDWLKVKLNYKTQDDWYHAHTIEIVCSLMQQAQT